MFSDPQSVTVATVAKSLSKLNNTGNSSTFRTADRVHELTITQTSGRRNQGRARKNNSKIIVDPLASDRNVPVSMSCYVVVDTPLTGYSATEIKDELIALADWLKAGTNADKLVAGEI